MRDEKMIYFADEKYADMGALRRAFSEGSRQFAPFLYYPIENSADQEAARRVERRIADFKKDGFAGVIPYYPSEAESRPFAPLYLESMQCVYETCAEFGLFSGYFDDPTVMASYLETHPEDNAAMDCRILCDYEHECRAGEVFRRSISPTGTLLALNAVEADTAEVLDLRAFVVDGERIEWSVPEGNWILHQYVCEQDHDARILNLLDYDACAQYFTQTCGALREALSADACDAMRLLVMRNVQYAGKNRRMWSEKFNEVFQARYGFDPAPYYPCLFQDTGADSAHYRALLMSCRASMLSDGYMKAAADFAEAHGMRATGFAIESKATACSWLFGDGQMLHQHTAMPGVSMPFSYLYGLNGVKVAAGLSDTTGRGLVSADLFRRYEHLDTDILCRETLNVMGRGVNFFMAHLEDACDIRTPHSIFSRERAERDYAEFCSRVSLLMRGGTHVSDVAVLYPIHSVHARTYLYDGELSGFEYPAVLERADYMNIMNNLLTYCGVDADFLHPDVLEERYAAKNGNLTPKDSDVGYSVVILPGTDMIRVETLRVLRDFFDGGGRILASGCLPEVAFAGKPGQFADDEVRALCTYIFGADAVDPSVVRENYVNKNDRGGIACFVPAITTAVDGTDMIPAADMLRVLHSFGLPRDVIVTEQPRIEYSGILACDLPTFTRLFADVRRARGGSLGYLHRRNALGDIYFFTNTSGEAYEHDVLIRGAHTLEEWNPVRGRTRRLASHQIERDGEIYTVARLTLPDAAGLFWISERV